MGHPRPAILVAGRRAGGTFLSTALSNHPQIFCTRGEPSHQDNLWRITIPDWKARLDLLLEQLWYEVSMCKLTLRQAIWLEGWEYIQQHVPRIKIIYLEREDVLEQAVSLTIHNARLHPQHTFEDVEVDNVTLDPSAVVDSCGAILRRKTAAEELLSQTNLQVLHLTYEWITQGKNTTHLPGSASQDICDFLEVTHVPLYSHLRKVHKEPYPDIVSNWHAVLLAVGASDVAKVLHKRRSD